MRKAVAILAPGDRFGWRGEVHEVHHVQNLARGGFLYETYVVTTEEVGRREMTGLDSEPLVLVIRRTLFFAPGPEVELLDGEMVDA